MNNRVTKTNIKLNGRKVRPGTELSFKGVSGRFRFVSAECMGDTILWVTVYGGSCGRLQFRSFNSANVRRVHAKNKLRSNA